MIPYGKHQVVDADIAAVVDVLENQFLTQGQMVPAFEQALCDYTQASYCTAVNSGTSGLHVACLALNVGPGDCVWTSPNSFVASANCALYCGADVDFVDINPITRNLDTDKLANKFANAEREGKLPKALVVVHFAGLSCDMAMISALAEQYGVKVIEDAAHGLGGFYQRLPIGSCKYSDVAVLSFHPVKSITTAEGGAVTTNDLTLAERIVLFAKHGVTRDPKKLTEQQGPWYYQQQELGFNYRLSDIHAALGLSQLKRLDAFIMARRTLAHRYHEAFSDLPVQLPIPSELATDSSAWHLYMIEILRGDRKILFEQLHSKGVGVNVHYIPIHLQPYYKNLGFRAGQFPSAERFYQRALTLPLFPDLTTEQQDYVISAVKEVLA